MCRNVSAGVRIRLQILDRRSIRAAADVRTADSAATCGVGFCRMKRICCRCGMKFRIFSAAGPTGMQTQQLISRCETGRIHFAGRAENRELLREGMPMKAATCLLMLLICMLSAGCHCCRWSECYNDAVDDVTDCDLCLDRYYCEKLDVTRWCMNRRCPPRCR